MKGYTDEMMAAGKHLDDEDVVCYILTGLDVDFNPFVEAFTAKIEPQTLSDLYFQLLTAKVRVEEQKEFQQQQINVNAAFRGDTGSRGPMRGRCNGASRGGRGGGHSNNDVCGKIYCRYVAKLAMVRLDASSALMQVTQEKTSLQMRPALDTMWTRFGTPTRVLPTTLPLNCTS
jgi:hypothetical protein